MVSDPGRWWAQQLMEAACEDDQPAYRCLGTPSCGVLTLSQVIEHEAQMECAHCKFVVQQLDEQL